MNTVFIKKLEIENYKSLRDSEITFESGINIVIGKNGAGKSNLLSFMRRNLTRLPLNSSRINGFKTSFKAEIINQTQKPKKIIQIEIEKQKTQNHEKSTARFSLKGKYTRKEFGKPEYISTFDSTAVQNDKGFKNQINDFNEALISVRSDIVQYSIPQQIDYLDNSISFTIDTENYLDYEPNVNIHIINKLEFAYDNYLDDHIIEYRRSNDEAKFKEALKNIANAIFEESDLILNLQKYSPIQNIKLSDNLSIYKKDDSIIVDNLKIEFLINDDWLPWSFLSDGTKRLFILISLFAANSLNVILIEEPELGIHPQQLYKLMDFLREQSERVQIIITTHSPIVLDALKPYELSKINICCLTSSGSVFKKLTKTQEKKAIQYMESVGELSYYWLHSDLEDA